jgi:putative tricarboxylic transport membrane protein
VGEWAFPFLVLLGAGAVAILLWRGRAMSEEHLAVSISTISPTDDRASKPALTRVTLGLVAFTALLGVAGFVVAGTVLFACVASAFGGRHWMRDAFIGLALCTVVYVLFVRGLGVALPGGLAAGWL